ncbi:MAG: hypothetical protein IMY74_06180, partial [Bacteroidetes bacterium]|nr:hypothetical protein [Bacteroidota bacterium]
QATPDTILAGNTTTLSWTSGYSVSCTIDQGIGAVSTNGSVTVSPAETSTYTITASGPGGFSTSSVTVTVHHVPAVGLIASPDKIIGGSSATITWMSTHADTCVIEPDIGTVAPNGSMTVTPSETTTYSITATGAGGVSTSNATVGVYYQSTVNISVDSSTIQPGEATRLSWTSTYADTCTIEPEIGVVDVNGSISVSPEHATTYIITAAGLAGVVNDQVRVKVYGNPEPQPEGSFGEQYDDLVPPDASLDSYDPRRFSLVTGIVNNIVGTPVENVSITIHDKPEYGTVKTDTEGKFTIPAEGGGIITLVFEKQGFITSHRQVDVPWNDLAIAETIQMIADDPVSTTLTFDGNADTVVTHQSSEISDEFGRRTCSMVFAGDNRAYLVDENGNDIQELTTITTRATEFSTPESMPAKLPANSGYTYCVELQVDDAQRVRFDKPVVTWVDNFLGFQVGLAVPAGYYDRDKGVWAPSENGVVVKLLDTDSNGIVDALDATGNDLADDLNEDGSFADEVIGLDDPAKYTPGSTFWRVPVSHFTPWDYNWPYGPPTDAIPPNSMGVPNADQQKRDIDDCNIKSNSYVNLRSRIYHEDIPIPGTDITLHYASNRVNGYQTKITVPASGDTVPDSLKRIIVQVKIAGRALRQILDPLPNQVAEFIWDGKDSLGRHVDWTVKAHVSVGFAYDLVYLVPGDFENAFGQAGGDLTGIRTREELISWKNHILIISSTASLGTIADGWTISDHHYMNPGDTTIVYQGNGGLINGNTVYTIETIAGTGIGGYSGDYGKATEAQLLAPRGLSVDPDGNIYIADYGNARIRMVDKDGIIKTIAGNGIRGYSGDGGVATEAQINVCNLTVDDSGNLYLVERENNRIRKVDSITGIIETVAGIGGESNFSGDGGPATVAQLNMPESVVVDAGKNIYFSDSRNRRVRKVDTNGIINTIAGYEEICFDRCPGSTFFYGGKPALETELNIPYELAIDKFNNLYVNRMFQILKIDNTGIITIVAGDRYYSGIEGDGIPAIGSKIVFAYGLAIDSAGNIFFGNGNALRRVDTNGIIQTIAGNGSEYSGEGRPASLAKFGEARYFTTDNSGNILVADIKRQCVRKISNLSKCNFEFSEGEIPFADKNGIGYIMSNTGFHKNTIELETGVELYAFNYDSGDNLISIVDQFGNQITIERDSNNVPAAIVSPDGIRTELNINANNELERISYADGSFYRFEYTAGGLMDAEIDPEGNRFDHTFDSTGRLTDIYDEEGGIWNYSRTTNAYGDILTEILTGEGNVTSYLDHAFSTGAFTSTITNPTGSQTVYSRSADGLTVEKSLACGMDLEFIYDLDSEYKNEHVKQINEASPAGLLKITKTNTDYTDTDSDEVPDLIKKTVATNGKITSLVHNTLTAQKTITSPEGRSVTSLYDPNTLLAESVSVSGFYDTIFGYDVRGRLTSATTNTRQTIFAYNTQGNLDSVTDPEDKITTYDYDPVGRVTVIHRPDTTDIFFDYDNNGNMTVLTNPSNIDHVFGFNKVNLNNSYQTPLSGNYSYLYDKDRRLVRKTFPSGSQINNIYDTTQLIQVQTPEGNIDFAYLCGAKVETASMGVESITYGYDGKLVTSETFSGTLNQSLSFTYNNDFNVESFTYAGTAVPYTYDNDGLLTGSGDYTINRNFGNGLPESVAGGTLNVARNFNGYGELDNQTVSVNSQDMVSWNLTRNNNGRITGKTETADGITSSYAYTYDSMGRLKTVTKDGTLVEEYRYDTVPFGTCTYAMNSLRGISGRNLQYNNEDQLLTAGATAFQYDLDGFLTAKINGTEEAYYTYSSRSELLDVTLPDGRYIEYLHDPIGRRIAKKVDGVIVEKYLWQGLTRLLAVYDGSDSLLMRFEYADGRMPVAMTSGGSTYYLAYDQVGSLRVVADDLGNVVKRIEYDAFGYILNDTNPSFAVPFGFAGGLHDRDTGLDRFGYRDDDPA